MLTAWILDEVLAVSFSNMLADLSPGFLAANQLSLSQRRKLNTMLLSMLLKKLFGYIAFCPNSTQALSPYLHSLVRIIKPQ
jgi:hypothetical protein